MCLKAKITLSVTSKTPVMVLRSLFSYSPTILGTVTVEEVSFYRYDNRISISGNVRTVSHRCLKGLAAPPSLLPNVYRLSFTVVTSAGLNVAVEMLAPLLRTLEVPCSNFGPDTDYTE